MGHDRIHKQVLGESANIIARMLLSLKGQSNWERVLRNRRKQTLLLFSRRTSRRTQETIGHLALL